MLLLTDITWTDQLTAVSSFGQCLALCAGLYIAMRELRQSRSVEIAKAADAIFDRFAEKSVDDAISRISTDEVNPLNDRMMIKSILTGDDMERKEQCEADILLLTNLYSRIWDQFDNQLIDQNRFLQNFDEVTLYICHALHGIRRLRLRRLPAVDEAGASLPA